MKIKKILLGLLILLTLWITVDLLIVSKSDIRQFGSVKIARLDTEMWRSYYDNKPVKLFFQLGTMVREKYKARFWHSQFIAFQAAKAAFIFKKGDERADYEMALPALRRYYAAINRISRSTFDVKEAAKLELEWWIIHRQSSRGQDRDLEKALAISAAAIYQIPQEQLIDYARFRTAAMEVRDTKARENGLSEEDWVQINILLNRSWQSLFDAVNIK